MRSVAVLLCALAVASAMPAPLLSLSLQQEKNGVAAPARPLIAQDFLADTEVEIHNATTGAATFGEGAPNVKTKRGRERKRMHEKTCDPIFWRLFLFSCTPLIL
jgi:hypothetical protein